VRTSKLLELVSLLQQYAESADGARQLVARSLAKMIDKEARAQLPAPKEPNV
jgi:hypothetical protein